MESGGAFKSGCPKKKGRSRSSGRVYARMRNRDTRPLYEQYLMDCIGRAQTLNLTFTIIAALRGGLHTAPRNTVGWRDRTMFDVNFIILAKKLRPGSSPSDPFSLSPVSRRPSPRYPLYFCFSLRIFLCRNNFFFRLRASLISLSLCVCDILCILCAFTILSLFSI